ncbi:MAG: histidine phosphatase family protein [Candidatus Lokiarchaeota archaeon]|nr:histidine phosphatase family protein [Candidatus Lokiarchaeota archaeon]
MNVEKIWKEEEWTTHARAIIDNLEKFPKDSKIILVLRHSHRNEPTVMEKIHKLRLTPKGHAIAKKFGERLPTNRPIRLFHSKIWRCQETAENIHEGFKSIGGKSDLLGELSSLYEIGIGNQSYADQFLKFDFREILLRWASGFYLPEEWTPFIEYTQNAAHLIWNQLKDAPQRGINIYVTHDWHVMTLKFGWFAVPPDKRWVFFNGGFAFTLEEEHILLLDYGQFKKLDIPHWWKKKK